MTKYRYARVVNMSLTGGQLVDAVLTDLEKGSKVLQGVPDAALQTVDAEVYYKLARELVQVGRRAECVKPKAKKIDAFPC